MKIKEAAKTVLLQLNRVIDGLDLQDYNKPSDILSGATLGQHIRHTLEFFTCLRDGCQTGVVNYDNRSRDIVLEEDPAVAGECIKEIISFIDKMPAELPLDVEVNYDLVGEDLQTVESNFIRELMYNIEHAIHHMAILKIGLMECAKYVQIPEGFGVAVSTLRYQKSSVPES